jgi:hypothetical protein
MTSQGQPPSQNSGNNDLNQVIDNEQNVSSSSSSSSSRPPMSAYRHLLQFKEAAGLIDQAEFDCPRMAKEKDRAAKLEAIAKEYIGNEIS